MIDYYFNLNDILNICPPNSKSIANKSRVWAIELLSEIYFINVPECIESETSQTTAHLLNHLNVSFIQA